MLFETAYAQMSQPAVEASYVAWQFVEKINEVFLFPLLTLMMGVAVLYFMYGGFIYIINSDNDKSREEGRKTMLWGVAGLFVMLTAYALLSLATNMFGLEDELNCATNPTACGVPNLPGGP